MKAIAFCVFLSVWLLWPGGAPLAQATYHTKQVPMRDGKWLAADLYSMDTTVAKPVLLVQTPYDRTYYRSNIDIPAQAGGLRIPYDSLHYHVVTVDWRGFYGSTAAATASPDRGQDGYDCIQWLTQQSWCNGKVGTWGPSALGNVQFLTAAEQHPAHLCAMPLIRHPISGYEDYYTGGVYRKEHTETLVGIGFTVNVAAILAVPLYNAFWQGLEADNDIIPQVQIPMLLATGWFDHYPRRIVEGFWDLRARSAPAVRTAHKLIVGPWTHMDMDKTTVGSLTYPHCLAYTDSVARRFFDHYLRDVANGYPDEPAMRYYQMGTNAWRTTDQWPPVGTQARQLFLHADGSLQAATPGSSQTVAFDYAPHTPTPSFAGQRFNPLNPFLLTGPRDQSVVVESREDVLTFETPALTEALTLQGDLQLSAWVSLDRTDSDLNVRLTDVYPDGKSYVLGEGIRRLRLRDTLSTASLLTPGQVYAVRVRLDDIAHTFLPGHRLRITVAGSSSPRFHANLNNGGAMYTAGDTLVCRTTLHMGPTTPTALHLRVAATTTASTPAATPDPAFSLYPNPTNGQLWVTNPTGLPTTLHLYSMTGAQVAAIPIAAGTEPQVVDVSNLAPGMYLPMADKQALPKLVILK